MFSNGTAQAFNYDPVGRLSQLTNDLSGTTNDLTATFAYNPASQIANTVRTGDAYAWTGHGNGSTAYTENGLNQQATVGGAAAAWDSKGNLTTEPQLGKTYGYSSENLLTSASGGVTLSYDPALRLSQTVGAATTKFLYDGADAIAEYNGSGALQRRFAFDPTTGQPILWYEGTGTAATNRRYLSQDERGRSASATARPRASASTATTNMASPARPTSAATSTPARSGSARPGSTTTRPVLTYRIWGFSGRPIRSECKAASTSTPTCLPIRST
jgi:hypothetical protein